MGGKPTNEAKVFHCIDLSRDPAVTRVTGDFDESYGGASQQLIEQRGKIYQSSPTVNVISTFSDRFRLSKISETVKINDCWLLGLKFSYLVSLFT